MPTRARSPICGASFCYVFDPPNEKGGGIPQIELHTIAGPFAVGGVGIQPVPLLHGSRPILGFRFGDFAYLTDCNRIPTRVAAARRRRTCWCSTRCATGRIRRISPWPRR